MLPVHYLPPSGYGARSLQASQRLRTCPGAGRGRPGSSKSLSLLGNRPGNVIHQLDAVFTFAPYLFEIARGEIVLGLGYVGVVGSQFALVDLQSSLVVLLHLLSSARLLSCLATSGWSLPSTASRIHSARLHSGSASRTARLLSVAATAGWFSPSVFSRMDSASFSRLAASLYLFWSLKTIRNKGEYIEHSGDIRMVVSRGLLEVLEGLLAEWHGDLVPSLRRVLDDQVVQCAQAGRDLVARVHLLRKVQRRPAPRVARRPAGVAARPPVRPGATRSPGTAVAPGCEASASQPPLTSEFFISRGIYEMNTKLTTVATPRLNVVSSCLHPFVQKTNIQVPTSISCFVIYVCQLVVQLYKYR
ncbi:hypothetical protein HW555_003527 [Spodoptera exigua]|uniref:Uncharacterized protein n=1 Tax=Spodoptera exigua TaxID=7107 RepID=A0A835GJW7_SPOEX|nr:hypothetical protein HW555_003527 [Spodoptera exigua]